MRKFASCCVVLAPIALSTAAFAQVGVGTPDCHTQGTLYRVANHCPPAAIAAARMPRPAEAYWYPRQRHYVSLQTHRHRHSTASATAHPG